MRSHLPFAVPGRAWRILASLAALGSLAVSIPASASTSSIRLSGNVVSWASAARLLGPAASHQRIGVSVYLNLRNQQGLNSFLRQLYTPGSSQYHHFLTPAQFHARYSPLAGEAHAVKAFLSHSGLRVGYMPANRMYVDATGTVAQVEQAFHVTENRYRYSGRVLRANAQAPLIPSSLASMVRFVGGLDQSEALIKPQNPDNPNAPPGQGYSTPGPCSQYWGDAAATVTPSAYQYGSTLPWVICGYGPAQIRAAYGVNNTSMTGAGVRIGIVDAFASNTIVQDVNRYSQIFGLPALTSSNFRQVVVPGTYNAPENHLDPQGWYGEETLDIEVAHSIAPQATIVYSGAQNNEVPLDHALINMIDNHLADVISNSWGYLGEPKQYGLRNSEEQAFEQAAAEGISVLFSSGDNGDVAQYTGIAEGSWPATSPYVTAVGGTSLALNADGSKQEWGWGTYESTLTGSAPTQSSSAVTGTAWSPWPPTFVYGSGGGISLNYAQPWYQAGVVPSSLSTTTVTSSGQTVTFSTPHRVVPDVAMDADPNTGYLTGETYAVSGDPLVDQGCTQLGGGQEYCLRRIGGTSLASPTFAGVVALADQARFQVGKGTIGFLNPTLYGQTVGSIVGAPGSHAALEDVLPPGSPTALLRNIQSSTSTGLLTTLRTINSVPVGTDGPVIEGADSSLRTTPGYDDVTGLGTPYVPTFVSALASK